MLIEGFMRTQDPSFQRTLTPLFLPARIGIRVSGRIATVLGHRLGQEGIVMPTSPTTATDESAVLQCPLCERVPKKPKKCKPLHGRLVCPKCRNAFASRRQLAFVIDTVIWELLAMVPLYYLGLIPGLNPTGFSIPSGAVGPVEIFFSYVFPLTFYFKDGFSGQSPGKYACGVQVVDVATHEPTGFGRSFKRNLCLIIPVAPLIVLFLMMKGRRWGDGWAKTKVVWTKHRFNPIFDDRGSRCTKCGYDLTGNTTGRCPECFTPVSVKA